MRRYGNVYVKLLFMFLGLFSLSAIRGQIVKIEMISDVHDEAGRLQGFVTKAKTEKPDFVIQLGYLSEDYGYYPKELIFPFVKDRFLFY